MHYATKEQLIAFERTLADEWERGEQPCLLHLSGGNEDKLLAIFNRLNEGDWIFSTHRNHYHALLAGISEADLAASIMAGHSMFTYSRARNFFCSAILGGNCGIAAGVAWALKQQGSKNQVICFLGDGAEESGHFYEATLFVEANALPCLFIIEDNGIQVDTLKIHRRGSGLTANKPLDHFKCVARYYYQRTYPHAGTHGKRAPFKPEAVERMKHD